MVHIRRCSAGIRQQFLVAEWLGLRITVRVRVRARAREWNPFLFLFVFLFVCKCGGHHCATLSLIIHSLILLAIRYSGWEAS